MTCRGDWWACSLPCCWGDVGEDRQSPCGSAYVAADAPAALGFEGNEVSGELIDGKDAS